LVARSGAVDPRIANTAGHPDPQYRALIRAASHNAIENTVAVEHHAEQPMASSPR